jgi:hypothetical protein
MTDVTIGIIGNGFGAVQIYTTAIYAGFAPEQIGIFGEHHEPAAAYQRFAWNLGQTVLRSESESHFLPADWPTFAQLAAWARKDPSPLFRSAGRKFNPSVPDILAEVEVVTRGLRYRAHVIGGTRVGWLVREPGPPAHFSLYDENARLLGRCKHCMVAVGHGPLSFPGPYGRARQDPATADRVVQAYEPKRYFGGGRYLVAGSGIASINEWVNAVDAGAACIALRRNPHPDEQDLNVPRCLFDGSGIDAFQGLSFEERVEFLGRALRGTAPNRRHWAEKIRQAQREHRFEELIGDVHDIRPGAGGLSVTVEPYGGGAPLDVDVTGVVCGTGFVKSAAALPLLRRLIQTYDVPVHRDRIRLKTNCGIPPLDQPDSRLAMMGLNASTVVPNGDTIAGLKYIARRFVGDVDRAERIRRRRFPSRMALQLGLARDTIRAIKSVPRTEQVA